MTDPAHWAQYRCEDRGGPWPDWVPMDAVLDLAEAYAEQYRALPDAAFTAMGLEVAETLCGPAGATLCDADRGGCSPDAVDALARAMALGSLCQEAFTLWGVVVRWVDD